MHRAHIDLQDDVYAKLKYQARHQGLSISEFIGKVIEKELSKGGTQQARAFFNALAPLESFAEIDAEAYVDEIRSNSRILHPYMKNPQKVLLDTDIVIHLLKK